MTTSSTASLTSPAAGSGATEKVDWPILTNLRLDPYERTGMFNGKDNGSINYYNWFAYEFWRFVFAQQVVAKAAQSLIDFPPMQPGASTEIPKYQYVDNGLASLTRCGMKRRGNEKGGSGGCTSPGDCTAD